MDENLSKATGPGSIVEQEIDIKPLLDGASEYEYVDILNPLDVEFIGVFGSTKPVNTPMTVGISQGVNQVTRDEAGVRNNYGLDLRNPDFQSKAHIQNKVPIKSGQTIRLLGNEAQVIVRQLVNEILQREGKKLSLADPYQRKLVEQRIIIHRGDARQALGRDLQEEIKEQKSEEVPFATIGGGDSPTADDSKQSETRGRVGRPPKKQTAS